MTQEEKDEKALEELKEFLSKNNYKLKASPVVLVSGVDGVLRQQPQSILIHAEGVATDDVVKPEVKLS